MYKIMLDIATLRSVVKRLSNKPEILKQLLSFVFAPEGLYPLGLLISLPFPFATLPPKPQHSFSHPSPCQPHSFI